MRNKYLQKACLKAFNIFKFLCDNFSYQVETPGEWR